MIDLEKLKKHFYLLIACFAFALFFYISYNTPLCGDDWGYALGDKGPIAMAVSFFASWSGRFFSEIWDFFMCRNKEIWNVVNALMFSGIYILLYKISDPKKYPVFVSILILFIMITVSNELRAQTYTFVTGTIYPVPLFCTLLFLYIFERVLDGADKKLLLLCSPLLVVAGMMTENMSATVIVSLVLLLIYCFVLKKDILPYCLFNLLVSISSFLTMRMSPGSSLRLLRDHPDWIKLSLFSKLAGNYPHFLSICFIKNKYLIIVLSLVVIATICEKEKNNTMRIVGLSIEVMALIVEVAYVEFGFSSMISNDKSVFSMLFWPIYIVYTLYVLCFCVDGDRSKEKTIFYFLIAGTSVLVMLYSPIFGDRSSLYLVFILSIVIASLIEELNINKSVCVIVCLLIIAICTRNSLGYIKMYRSVNDAYTRRLSVIQYYVDNPDVEEAWIPRFPQNVVHSADIEPGDDYHLQCFKDYYHIPQSWDKIIFYFE